MRRALLALTTLLAPALADRPGAQSGAVTYRIVPGASRASYAVDEVFLRENRLFTAVGVTPEVSGEIAVDRARPAESRVGEIVVDLSRLASDDPRRDRALRRKYLDSDRLPHARFAGGTFHHLPAAVRDGAPFPFTVVGDLTVRGVARRTTWHGEAVLAGDTLRGEASTRVKMSDFGIEVPNLLSLRSEDDVTVKLAFVAVADRHPTRRDP